MTRTGRRTGEGRWPRRPWYIEEDRGYVTPCWMWQRHVRPTGYGQWTRQRITRQAHRAVYEEMVGPIPDGLTLDHLCRVRACVNPAHLEPVTVQENTLRGDGFAARNAAKTHCVRGHAFTPENTYLRPTGRACRECVRNASRAYKRRQRLARRAADAAA